MNKGAWGKMASAQAVQEPLALTDEDVVHWIQLEEVVAQEAHQGRDAATLEVVMEATGPFTRSQLGDLGALATQTVAPPLVGRPSQPSIAVAV